MAAYSSPGWIGVSAYPCSVTRGCSLQHLLSALEPSEGAARLWQWLGWWAHCCCVAPICTKVHDGQTVSHDGQTTAHDGQTTSHDGQVGGLAAAVWLQSAPYYITVRLYQGWAAVPGLHLASPEQLDCGESY